MGFATDAIHAGQEPDPTTGAIMTPIYQTSTYVLEELGKTKGFDYARTINPTRLALEKNLAALEGGEKGFCFASGMSAIAAVMTLVKQGDHVVVSNMTYGGTFRLFEQVLKGYGLEFTYVDTSDLAATEKALRPKTRMLYLETPTNPLMGLTDLEAASRLAKKHSLISVVDNTFMSPYFQKPLALGIDIVLHSTTKFLNGHSDSVGGCVVTTRPEHAERIGFVQNAVGAILSPFDSWLVLRGVKTLHLRMPCHDANGRRVADFLSRHPKVKRVLYPGLPTHPQHELAKRQCTGFGGMISFDLGDYPTAKKFLDRVKLCALAESLGGVETLICHPGSMTHASIPEAERNRLGFTSGLVRLSVGNEDVEDILEDLKAGLAGI
ncbi:MAG TPA: PLP-dependent aspartate aminotransferase family protein [Candidatus Polarisedimenticolia bacterium]|nr:PLP-dependent aspartate aminotransferase family protein [Candidatus Polarisedimenticolia bacterium]